MTETTTPYRELAAILRRHALVDGEFPTAIPGLVVSRRSRPTEPVHTAVKPCLALVVQGSKSLAIGSETLRYAVGDFLIVSLDLPIVSRVTMATAKEPHLGVGLALDIERLASLLARVDVAEVARRGDEPDARGASVNAASPLLLDGVVRLVRLLDTPGDITALAPLFTEEILYRLLTGPCALRLLSLSRADTPARSVLLATRWLRDNFAEPFRVEDLARRVGMSASSLHHHFKAQTTLSPLQYQKQIRLNEARRLIVVDKLDVGGASQTVGYQSASQFTRDYGRMFGQPPSRDAGAGLVEAPVRRSG